MKPYTFFKHFYIGVVNNQSAPARELTVCEQRGVPFGQQTLLFNQTRGLGLKSFAKLFFRKPGKAGKVLIFGEKNSIIVNAITKSGG